MMTSARFGAKNFKFSNFMGCPPLTVNSWR